MDLQTPTTFHVRSGATQAVLHDGGHEDGTDEVVEGSSTLRCKIQLDGFSRYEFGRNPCVMAGSSLVFLYSPPGETKRVITEPDTNERSITFVFPVSGDCLDDLDREDPEVNNVLSLFRDTTVFSHINVPGGLLHLARDIFSLNEGRHFQRILSLKLEELSCNVLDFFIHYHNGRSDVALGARERRQMAEVHKIITENISESYTLDFLSSQVGTNRTKLNQNFRATFGLSVFDFIRQTRMELANSLIRDGKHSITEIAEVCGYDHLSNFSSAFKTHFGRPPSALRQISA